MIVTDYVFAVRINKTTPLDSFSCNALGGEAAELAARACRDRYNASEHARTTGGRATIFRCKRTSKVRRL